ncbi:hypothetical protein K1T71_000541 [Dendrolimus kikuchii]|uniref:Uncharacterized protein n=1 Tax=Dendrolimus kikuchii TaxID=765133 RepID=A0ACC1DJH6_9NEOP|nr:hypothetical protein K1T71_000541 [Dendrolimus kikuchii]
MPTSTAIGWSSSLSIFSDKKDHNIGSHFRWHSIKAFLYIACVFSSSTYNFDIFSRIAKPVRIYEFVLCEMTVGMPYMVMDGFIKQYTAKLDCGSNLNPLLKGVTYGSFLQNALWALIHAGYLADSIRYLVTSLQIDPSWRKCQLNTTCISSKDVLLRCGNKNITQFTFTSAHFNYLKSFSHLDRSVLTTRFFVLALVWIFNFFFATVQDDSLLKLFKITFLWRFLSTVVTLSRTVQHIAPTFGVGFLGLYDFQSTSPYTMIDNAVVIFSIVLTGVALLRSWIVRILYKVLNSCVLIEFQVTPHYLIFAVLPLSTEFFYAHKLYVFYVFVTLTIGTMVYLCILTITMSKLLHNEFKSVKNIYVVGLLCCVGFILTVPINVSMTTSKRVRGLAAGLHIIVLYLGGFKVAIVMWIYGVQRFSTDIQFWLGFKPTNFWVLSWMILPIVLMLFLSRGIYKLAQSNETGFLVAAVSWIIISLLVVHCIQFKTIAKYIFRNNLAGAFSCNSRYGPPDPDDRKRRMNYNETMRLRQCKHDCNVLDEHFDCNHLPLITKNKPLDESSSASTPDMSLTNIFEAGTSTKVKSAPSSILIAEENH